MLKKTPLGSFSSLKSIMAMVRDLGRRRERQEAGLFLVEGPRAVREALAAGMVETLLYTQDLREKRPDLIGEGIPGIELSARNLKRLSSTDTPQGILAVAKMPMTKVDDLVGPTVVLDGLQDPGNLGTILRAAAAFGAKVAYGPGSVDPYNPKVVRSAAGYLFRSPPVALPHGGVQGINLLRQRGFRIYGADPKGETALEKADLKGSVAVWIGNEGNGLPEDALAAVEGRLRIPTMESVESLNAGVAAAIILYEIFRQGIG